MRQTFKVLTCLIIFTFIVSGLLLFGTLDATEVEPSDCQPYSYGWGCQDGQSPEIQPKPICPNRRIIPRCPMDAAE